MNKVRTRFAPSPTGYLHIGGLRTALYSYLFAKNQGGDFILRIEDTDRNRYVEGAVELIYSTLEEANLIWDEGPDKGGDFGPYVQSERKDIYLEYAKKLVELGGAYYCFCTKERLEGLTDENGQRKYDKKCLSLTKEEVEEKIKSGLPYVIRQNIPKEGKCSYHDLVFGDVEFDYKDMEDNILIKSDGMPTYNFANVVDDHLMGINYVMRGTEYLSSTPKYNLMYDTFGWDRPFYVHMPPIMKNSKEKLSKRNGDASYADFIEKGYIKDAIVNYIALLGWSPKGDVEKMSFEELKANFSIDGISKHPAIFDEKKMKWLNGEYFKGMTDEEFYNVAKPFIDKTAIAGMFDEKYVAKLMRTRVEILTEIADKVNPLATYEDFDLNLFVHQKMKCNLEVAKTVLVKAAEILPNVEWTNESIYAALTQIVAELEMKNSQVLWAFRIAITGLQSTPGGASEMAVLIGKEKTLERIAKTLERL
ncbi:MAG: glutamate--tRNA ligase [Clostridia bacterium]|nr:glutamate--tRNA ligase [Clostridia bacterium]MBR2875425.1 glutamate--tRNA ligase [Clostridia bacterium]